MDIKTFDNRTGAAVFFRAAGHPLAAEKFPQLLAELQSYRAIAIFDPEGYGLDLSALYDPEQPEGRGGLRPRIEELGEERLGQPVKLLSDLPSCDCDAVFVIDFDHSRRLAQLAPLVAGRPVISLATLRLPPGDADGTL